MTQVAVRSKTTTEITNRIAELERSVNDYRKEAKAPNTKRAYKSQWSGFVRFCEVMDLVSMPASVNTVSLYFADLADNGASVRTIKQAKSAISFAHVLARQFDPISDPEVGQLIAGISRKVGKPVNKKKAILRDDIRAMVRRLPATAKGKRDKALLLVGWFGAFRRSELAGLTYSDLDFRRDRITVTLSRSKTDQEGVGKPKHLPLLSEDNPLCPVRALRAWLDVASIKKGPLFLAMDRHGNIKQRAINDRTVARIVQDQALMVGLDKARVAGHSLRRGFVSQCDIDGVADSDTAQQTGQTLQTLQGYKGGAGVGAMRAAKTAGGDFDLADVAGGPVHN